MLLLKVQHWFKQAEDAASNKKVLGLSNYLDKCTPPEYFEITSENVDDRLESFLRRNGLRIDSLPQPNVTKSFLIDASWMWSTMLKLRNYLEPVKAKYLLSAMDNFARNIDIEAELSSSQIKVWNQAKASQQVIIDLLLDIIVEYCRHLETRSSVSSVDYYDTSSEPPSHRSGVFSQAEFLRQNGPEDSAQYPKYKTLEEKRTDVSEKAILESPPSETSAIDLLTINSIQDLKIKWPEPSEELLSMIINSLKCLCDTVPQGCSKPKRWPVSVKKISHVLDKAPKQLQLDLITLVPKLVDHSDHSRAAYALIHQLSRPDADPELQIPGNLPVHNSMDALAAAALSYEYDEGPKLVHRLDRESSGLLLMGRTKESISHLHWLFSDINRAKSSSKAWNAACEAAYQRYWALVIGSPKEKKGIICAPLSKVLLNDEKTERVILANCSGLEASQEAVTEYRVLGPIINGCSWIELCPHTSRKHQLRVHCAEALGTPIVGDYKYGWFVHRRWKQMPRVDFEPTTGKPYKLRRPEGLDVQKGSVLSKVPLLHLHCRELVLPNIAKFVELNHHHLNPENHHPNAMLRSKPDLLRFVASMPSHMKISWNLMSSYLI